MDKSEGKKRTIRCYLISIIAFSIMKHIAMWQRLSEQSLVCLFCRLKLINKSKTHQLSLQRFQKLLIADASLMLCDKTKPIVFALLFNIIK